MSRNSKMDASKQGNKSASGSGRFTSKWPSIPANLEERILDITNRIHQKKNILRSESPVDWEPYLTAGLLSETDYNFLDAFQHTKTKEERDELLDYFKEEAFMALVAAIQRVCIVEEIQKFLVMVDDMLWEDMSRIHRFTAEQGEPWTAFMDLLYCADNFTRNISGRIICKFMCKGRSRPSPAHLTVYLSWLKNELQKDNEYLLCVCRCLQALMKVKEYRLPFYNINGIFRIIRLLSFGIRSQAQYQLVFCIWMASFNAEISENLNKFNAIPVLFDLLEKCPAEIIKLPRVIIATFRNLLEKPREEGIRKHNVLVMLQCKVFKFLETIEVRITHKNIQDEEFMEDYHIIGDILKKYIAEFSTFDEYQQQVKSGRLEWSVVHTNTLFWKENADRLNDDKYELLKVLISLLETSDEVTVLCVASHDLGEYMSNYPRGKKVVQELGGKDALLRLLSHTHPVVKYHALRSLQILMLNNYDLLIGFATDSKTVDAVETWSQDKLDKSGL